jgi:hypothetical protein
MCVLQTQLLQVSVMEALSSEFANVITQKNFMTSFTVQGSNPERQLFRRFKSLIS